MKVKVVSDITIQLVSMAQSFPKVTHHHKEVWMFQYSDTLGSDTLFQTWIFPIQIMSSWHCHIFISIVLKVMWITLLLLLVLSVCWSHVIFIKFFLSQHFLGTVQKLFPSYFLHMWNNFPIDLGKTSINFGKLIKIQQSFILRLKDENNQIFNNIIKKYWKSTVCIVYLQYHENY